MLVIIVVGDVISVGGNVGVVYSIDTLSVKIQMFDNRFLRVPNETTSIGPRYE